MSSYKLQHQATINLLEDQLEGEWTIGVISDSYPLAHKNSLQDWAFLSDRNGSLHEYVIWSH